MSELIAFTDEQKEMLKERFANLDEKKLQEVLSQHHEIYTG